MSTQLMITSNKKTTAVRLLAGAAFLVMFQAYMVAPLLSDLAREFRIAGKIMGFTIPAFAIPYGLSSFFYEPLAQRHGRRRIILSLILMMGLGIFLIAMCKYGAVFLVIRILLGLVTGAIIPVSISIVGDLYPSGKRDQPFSWLFLGMAGGMTFGPTFGGYLYPIIGWRWEFIIVGLACMFLFYRAMAYRHLLPDRHDYRYTGLKIALRKSRRLLAKKAGKKMYGFIFLNGIFHSGLFVWISYYFDIRYHLADQAAGLALLLFGLPGLLMAVGIGTATQKYGSGKVILLGLLLVAVTVGLLVAYTPVWVATLAVAFLSVGYVMTQPLFAGIINNLRNGKTRGLALGLGTCLLFLGYGTGPIIFQYLLGFGLLHGLVMLAILAILLALLSVEKEKSTNITRVTS